MVIHVPNVWTVLSRLAESAAVILSHMIPPLSNTLCHLSPGFREKRVGEDG